MVRYRSRSISPRPRTRTPPRSRKYYHEEEDYRDRRVESRSYRDRRSPGPSGLLVRNLPLDARAEDLRGPFEKFGPVKDVYLPKNFYTGEPRGFGFVKYRYAEDAAEAKQHMNHKIIGGREIRIVFAEENRKTPHEMRVMSGRHGGSYRDRTPPRSPRRRRRSYSRSPTPPRHYFRERPPHVRDDYHSSRRSRSVSRSHSPRDEKDYRSNQRSPSPIENGQSPHDAREYASDRSGSPRVNGHTTMSCS